MSRLLDRIRYAPSAVAWLREHVAEYDVVIVSGLWNYATHVARRVLPKSGVPYVVFPHGMLDPWFLEANPVKGWIKRLLWLVNEGPLLNHADRVLFTSEEERRLARGNFWPYRVKGQAVSYGTADLPAASDRQRKAFAFRVPRLVDRDYLLFLGRLHQKKGCDMLVDAFAEVASERPDLDLVLAGPDQVGLKADLLERARRLGIGARVHWSGMLEGEEKWGAVHGCQAMVLPSHQENFGIVAAEAMAAGRPVLLSNRVNIWREVEQAGAGIVEPDTATGTERLLRRFLALSSEERDEMGRRARATFLSRFEIGEAGSHLISILNAAIARRADSSASVAITPSSPLPTEAGLAGPARKPRAARDQTSRSQARDGSVPKRRNTSQP